MNKKLKIAVAAVSVVMAGTMAFGMFGCTNTPDDSGSGLGTVTVAGNTYDKEIPTAKATTNAAEIVKQLNETAKLGDHITAKDNAWQRLKAYSEGKDVTSDGKQKKYEFNKNYPATTTLGLDIGDDVKRGVAYTTDILNDKVTMPDGNEYGTTALKPAWAAVKKSLGFEIENKYSKKASDSSKVETAITSQAAGNKLEDRVIITDGVDTINTNSEHFLDLSNYLDDMPNYKKFLEDYPVVKLSLTSNTTTGAMYAAPYFDGNDDIEKYVLCKINWVESLLDANAGDTTTTFKSHAETKSLAASTYASIQSFMGTKGGFNVSGLDKDGNKLSGGIDINYDKALEAAKSETSPLGAAIKAAAGVSYAEKEGAISGNIVDMMNFAINYSEGECTGAQLLKIMQEYIKVTYYVGGTTTPMYTQTGYKLSDVFTGYAAAWDVDLYAALGRCLVTNPSLIKSGKAGNTIGGAGATTLANLYLCANRQGNMQRMIDTTSFVGELYGVRGLESRNKYSYIDANGNLQDPRGDYESYDAFNAFSKFYAEGLATDKGAGNNGETSYYQENQVEALSYHDYSNTQTPGGFQLSGVVSDQYDLEAGYNFTSILTPVSKWNTKSEYDPDTKAPKYDSYMRFTESWRSVKDTGFGVPVNAVKDDPDKLGAVLALIDYMFSPDGQIELTYGPMAENAESKNGFWFNNEATADQISKGEYFEYKGKKYYSDVYYAGKYQPKVTEKVKKLYYGEEVNGIKVSGTGGFQSGAKCVRDYTAFARHVVGSALPIGNKLQSFEYQMTSDMGLAGAQVVDKAVKEGVVLHPVLDIKGINNNPWYASMPTLLPYTANEKQINTSAILVSGNKTTHYFTNDKGATTNFYWEIIKNGYDASKYATLYDAIGLSKS